MSSPLTALGRGGSYQLTVRRGDQTLKVVLVTRRLI
jgi:hypothetical protein